MILIADMSSHFPGAQGLEAYWQLIKANRSAIGDPPLNRSELVRVANALQIPMRGGYIAHEHTFDAARFHLPKREALRMAPQQQLVLTHACAALNDAGLTLDALKGSRTGVFVGAMANDLEYIQSSEVEEKRGEKSPMPVS
jgi:acyl transferase domain-containing protein